MRRSLPVLTALFVLVALPAAASSSIAKTKVLKTRGNVVALAADGTRVAALTIGIANACDRVVVWTPAKNALARIATGVDCPNFDGSVDELNGLALANKRVAWIEGVGGNTLELSVRSRTLGANRTVTVSSYAENGYGAGEAPDGDWVGNIAGHGSLLAYNRWHACTAYPATVDPSDYGPHCDQPALGDSQDYTLSEQTLFEVVGRSSVEIASAPDTHAATFDDAASISIVAVDANRIATLAENGEVTLYSPAGDVLQQIAVPDGTFAGTALQGSQLVTLRDGNLELYDVDSGQLVNTIPVAEGSVLRDLHKGLAVYVLDREVHVLRLSDEKSVTFSPPGTGTVDAQIEASGLFYSYNVASGLNRGRVVFVPWAKLVQKLG